MMQRNVIFGFAAKERYMGATTVWRLVACAANEYVKAEGDIGG